MTKSKKTFLSFAVLVLAVLLLLGVGVSGLFLRARRERAVLDTVLQTGEEFNISPALILAIISVESDFRESAVSAAGACGLMQLMPETYRFVGEELLDAPQPDSAIFTPEVNIRFGVRYLRYLYGRFGDWEVTLAAYNAGEGRVSEWLQEAGLSEGEPLTAIPFPETAAYVKNVLRAYTQYCKKYDLK